MFNFYSVFVFLCIFGSTFSQEYVNYQRIGMSYKHYTKTVTWNQARVLCEVEDATLAMPKTSDEVETLASIFNYHTASGIEGSYFWIGYHDYFEEGSFIDVKRNRAIPNTLIWYPGEPNELKINSPEECAVMFSNKLIGDARCDSKLRFFCEKEMNVTTPSQHLDGYNLMYMLWPKNISTTELESAIRLMP